MYTSRTDPRRANNKRTRDGSFDPCSGFYSRSMQDAAGLPAGTGGVDDLELLGVHLLVADPDLGAIVALGPRRRIGGREGQVLLPRHDRLVLFADLRLV